MSIFVIYSSFYCIPNYENFILILDLFLVAQMLDRKVKSICGVRSVNNLILMEHYGSKGKKGSLIIIYN